MSLRIHKTPDNWAIIVTLIDERIYKVHRKWGCMIEHGVYDYCGDASNVVKSVYCTSWIPTVYYMQ